MGRKAIAIDAVLLGLIVAELEGREKFASRSALWAAVAADERSKAIGLQPQVAMMKAKAWGIAVTTPLGERGRRAGTGLPAEAKPENRKPRSVQRISLDIVSEMKAFFPESVHGKVNRAAKGSYKAAVQLKCMDCTCNQKKEIALCTIRICPLWAFRPYRNATNEQMEMGEIA